VQAGGDNLNPYYEVGLKEARLDRLKGKPGFSFVRVDIADREGMARLFGEGRFDAVVHLAAQAGVFAPVVRTRPPRRRMSSWPTPTPPSLAFPAPASDFLPCTDPGAGPTWPISNSLDKSLREPP